MEPSSDSKTNAPGSLDSKTGSADSDSWLEFREYQSETCNHGRNGYCRQCDTEEIESILALVD